MKFSDFYLARVSGEAHHRARCDRRRRSRRALPRAGVPGRHRVRPARPRTCTRSRSRSAAGCSATCRPNRTSTSVRTAIAAEPLIGPVLADCLRRGPARTARPPRQAAERIEEAVAAEAQQRAAGGGEATKMSAQFQVGGVIDGRYEIRESLGVGGFAHTWRAWDTVHRGRPGHQAVPRRHRRMTARREFAMADSIRHDLCARVYDVHPGDPATWSLSTCPAPTSRSSPSAEPA